MESGGRNLLTQAVKAEALRLGFLLVGVTTPDPPAHFGLFQTWLQADRHGEMAYLASQKSLERRADPRQILPECKSILVLAVPYQPARPPAAASEPFSGLVAAYAWGQDYHDVLAGRLQALVHFIEARLGRPVPNRWYTDSGPLLERELAQRAGLGWIGKNSCLIHPRHGSYFLLAEILLGVELDCEAADNGVAADHCGTCRRCIEACPTDCILPDRTIDAPRCISYLTIELRGPIPTELRKPIGNWAFGCDICQQVCPWNRFASSAGDAAFVPSGAGKTIDLLAVLALSPEQFNQRFKGSPVKRARRRGFLRNAAVALANQAEGTQDEAVIAALGKCLADREPLARQHAAWALGRVGGAQARSLLEQALPIETEEAVHSEIRAALERLA